MLDVLLALELGGFYLRNQKMDAIAGDLFQAALLVRFGVPILAKLMSFMLTRVHEVVQMALASARCESIF